MSELRDLIRKNLDVAAARYVGKAWNPGGSTDAPNTSPDTPIPARPSAGPPGHPGVWVTQAPPVPESGFGSPGVWVLQPSPGPGGAPGGDPGTWSFQESIPAHVSRGEAPKGGVSSGDLVHFNGPGDSAFTVSIVQVTQGHAIGEFAGQTVAFPTTALTASPGGSDRAPNTTPSELGPVHKLRDIYSGGEPTDDDSGFPSTTQPDAGAPDTPVEFGWNPAGYDGGGTLNPVQGTISPAELALVNSASSRYGAGQTYDTADDMSDEDLPVLHKALDRVAFGAPGMTAAVRRVQAKLAG